jgi:hypothetical protein
MLDLTPCSPGGGHERVQTVQEKLLGFWRPLLFARKDHVQHRQRSSADGYRRTQQAPSLVGLEIGPVDDDHGSLAAQQPVRHVTVNLLALTMKMGVAQEAVERLQRSAYALGIGPGTSHVHQRQSSARHQRLDRAKQYARTRVMHGFQ